MSESIKQDHKNPLTWHLEHITEELNEQDFMINLSVKKQLLQDVTETEYMGSWTRAVYLMCSVEFTNTAVLQYKQLELVFKVGITPTLLFHSAARK